MEIGQNETQMGQWLLQNGPISVGLNANAMQFYRGGGTPAPRTPDTRGRSDTSRAATMRTGGHTFGYFIQLYPSYNFQLQHEELAEVEQGGAGAELGLDSEEFCDGTHTNMVLAGLDVLCR